MSVLFVTGAGISANAGIPTYRDGGSSWRDEDLEKKSQAHCYGNHLDELWDKHWGPVSEQMREAQPTLAHRAIAEFQKTNESIVATQNIDDLHERAGSNNVAHVHGSMTIKCMRCRTNFGNQYLWCGEGSPRCTECGSKKMRPDVVLFGEMLNAKMYNGLVAFSKEASHVVVVGSSLNVQPIGGMVMDTLSSNAKTILINKGETMFSKWFNEVHDTDADLVIEDVLSEIT